MTYSRSDLSRSSTTSTFGEGTGRIADGGRTAQTLSGVLWEGFRPGSGLREGHDDGDDVELWHLCSKYQKENIMKILVALTVVALLCAFSAPVAAEGECKLTVSITNLQSTEILKASKENKTVMLKATKEQMKLIEKKCPVWNKRSLSFDGTAHIIKVESVENADVVVNSRGEGILELDGCAGRLMDKSFPYYDPQELQVAPSCPNRLSQYVHSTSGLIRMEMPPCTFVSFFTS